MMAVGTILGCAAHPTNESPAGMSPPSRPLFGSKGAPWTIRCLELQGPQRKEQMEQFAETLKRTPGIRAKEVFVRDDPDGFARLYYGTYYRKTDAKSGKRSTPAQWTEDLKLIKQLGGGPGQYYFLRALTVRIPMPDVGRPEWNLVKAAGDYSLQVGVFEPNDDFWEYKQAAAEFCALLRAKGFEAYYYHTEASSMVTVGLFGASAVVDKGHGIGEYGREVLELQQRDDLLKYNRVNGGICRARSDKGEMVPVPSRLVHVPRPAGVGR